MRMKYIYIYIDISGELLLNVATYVCAVQGCSRFPGFLVLPVRYLQLSEFAGLVDGFARSCRSGTG